MWVVCSVLGSDCVLHAACPGGLLHTDAWCKRLPFTQTMRSKRPRAGSVSLPCGTQLQIQHSEQGHLNILPNGIVPEITWRNSEYTAQ